LPPAKLSQSKEDPKSKELELYLAENDVFFSLSLFSFKHFKKTLVKGEF